MDPTDPDPDTKHCQKYIYPPNQIIILKKYNNRFVNAGGEPELPGGPAEQDVRGIAREAAGAAAAGRQGSGGHPGRTVSCQLQSQHGPRPGKAANSFAKNVNFVRYFATMLFAEFA
jgi:hypothetical protein